ncbi:hypothetical protein LTR15_008527 [Elasticomyces elasticus]|nr:hypothetical protein LTR15_008527 [Elasticomyces elasticus]
MDSLLGSPASAAMLLLSGVLLVYVVRKAYIVATSALSRVPGPTHSKWTNLPLKWATLTGERVRYVHSLHEIYGPIVRISPHEVSLADTAAAKQIYKMGSHFHKSIWYRAFTGYRVDNLFTFVDPHEHGPHRRLTAFNFSEKAIKDLEPYIAKNVKLSAVRMKEEVEKRGFVDVFKWFTFMKNQYIADLESIGSRNIFQSELPLIVQTMSRLPFGPAVEIKKAVGRMIGYTEESVERYWKQLKADPENVKPTLLMKEYAAVENGTLPASQLGRDALGYIVAGTDTTAVTATYAVWRLAQLPEVQEALIREVSALSEGFGDEDLKPLKYLDGVINETLRLSTPVQQGLPRIVPEGGADFNGYYIPASKTVGVQSYTLHRDPTVWPKPEVFDPLRWGNATKEMKESFYPWGGGSRICIGMHFAQLELRYALAHFYRTFAGGMKPAFVEGFTEEDMLQLSYFLCPPKGKRCLSLPLPLWLSSRLRSAPRSLMAAHPVATTTSTPTPAAVQATFGTSRTLPSPGPLTKSTSCRTSPKDMPGWNPNWASEGGHGGPNTNTKVTAAVGNGILGHVINQCSKTIYVRTAIGPNDGVNSDGIDDPVGGTYAIAPGAWYTTTIRPVINGKSGVSVRLSDSATTNVVYQIEYAQKANGNGNMAIWYDLSGLDGNPFGNEKRYMQVNWDGNACENLYNAPGSTGMDWLESNPHTQKECENVGDVYFWLC